jgi:hypothetical protein
MRDVFALFEGPEARDKGSRFKALMTLANHPELAQAWRNYNVFLSKDLSLPQRLGEIVILRVEWRLRSEYEWTLHAVELLFLIGTYGMLAWIFSALRVEPQPMSAEKRREVILSPENVYGQRTIKVMPVAVGLRS